MKSKYHDIEEMISFLEARTHDEMIRSDCTPIVEIYKSLKKRSNQLILECGVRKGVSSSMFTHHSELTNGECYSIDIEDCSDVISSDKWFFYQSDDTDEKKNTVQIS